MQGQLWNLGEDASGQKLSSIGGDYQPLTILLKQQKGLPTDRITLFDEGTFYESFRIVLGADFFEILSDPFKGGENLKDRWGDKLEGLNDDNLQKVIDIIREKVFEEIRTTILA